MLLLRSPKRAQDAPCNDRASHHTTTRSATAARNVGNKSGAKHNTLTHKENTDTQAKKRQPLADVQIQKHVPNKTQII